MKSTISLTLDTEIVLELRKRNIKVSPVANDFFKEYLEIKPSENKSLGEEESKLLSIEVEVANQREKVEALKKKESKKIIFDGSGKRIQ